MSYVNAEDFEASKVVVKGGSAYYQYTGGAEAPLVLEVEGTLQAPRVYDGVSKKFVDFKSGRVDNPRDLTVKCMSSKSKLDCSPAGEQAILAVQAALLASRPDAVDSSLALSTYGADVGLLLCLRSTNTKMKIASLFDVARYPGVEWYTTAGFLDGEGKEVKDTIAYLAAAAGGVEGTFTLTFDKLRMKEGKLFIGLSLRSAQGTQVTEVPATQSFFGSAAKKQRTGEQ